MRFINHAALLQTKQTKKIRMHGSIHRIRVNEANTQNEPLGGQNESINNRLLNVQRFLYMHPVSPGNFLVLFYCSLYFVLFPVAKHCRVDIRENVFVDFVHFA